MDRAPNHHDAELVLRLYDLRREAVMRQHRAQLIREFWPRDAAEAADVVRLDHPLNTAYRQVTTYWEMAFALCRHKTLSPDVLLDTSAEGLFIYARIEPYVDGVRTAAGNPRVLRATQWIATETDIGRQIMDIQRARVKRALEARARQS
jgi:hypothetical protein